MSGHDGNSAASANLSGSASEVRSRIASGAGRVMVVDDDPVVREVTQRILRVHGFEAVLCSSGEEAVAMYRTLAGALDVILVDMCMPGMDGFDTFRELRAIRPDAIVVLFSGAADAARIQMGLDQGAAAFLPKPFTPEMLVRQIGSVLAGARDEAPMSPIASAR